MPLVSIVFLVIGGVSLVALWVNAAFMADCRTHYNTEGLAYGQAVAYKVFGIFWYAFACACLAIRFLPPA